MLCDSVSFFCRLSKKFMSCSKTGRVSLLFSGICNRGLSVYGCQRTILLIHTKCKLHRPGVNNIHFAKSANDVGLRKIHFERTSGRGDGSENDATNSRISADSNLRPNQFSYQMEERKRNIHDRFRGRSCQSLLRVDLVMNKVHPALMFEIGLLQG